MLKKNSPIRTATEVGPGDYVKVGSTWQKITGNTAFGATRTPRSWEVSTEGGQRLGMFEINRYAKAEDVEGG